jgi:hypothetical protein
MKSNLRTMHCTCPVCRGQSAHPEKVLHEQINLLLSLMNARQRRLFAAFQAQQFGHGGITWRISGLDRKTIRRGIRSWMKSTQTVRVVVCDE